MSFYLDFLSASCKNCYKCLRECPVKAIEVINNRARIIESRCILCGKCTYVCHQNAKYVHSEIDDVEKLLKKENVVASVAPSFVSSFLVNDFEVIKTALKKLGFADAEETAVGANIVTNEYAKLLKSGKYQNLISSACPSICKIIQKYYPQALKFLAPVDSPMVAHAKLLKEKNKNANVVFIGPCIAKKREGVESKVVDGVLTFEDLRTMFEKKGVSLESQKSIKAHKKQEQINKSKFYPISRGIIKSFDSYDPNYEFVSVDSVHRCMEVLDNIENLSGTFLEMSACDFSCVNGPCSLINQGMAVNASGEIRKYVNATANSTNEKVESFGIDIINEYAKEQTKSLEISDAVIKDILEKTGKFVKEDEMNCGACGYETCRQKAWAVANGYADVEMCVPYMRERAESMSYEIIKNSPYGIVVVDSDLNIMQINEKAMKLLGVDNANLKGQPVVDYCNPTDFVLALSSGKNISREKVCIEKTNCYVEMTVNLLKGHKVMFCIMKDITEDVCITEKFNSVKKQTMKTTEEVIKKQMRVAQEIASLLGETTAEAKVALLKLKATLENQTEK